jgi:hypothetical protein
VNPDECKDWPEIEVKIGPGCNAQWVVDLETAGDEHHARAAAALGMGEDEYKQAMRAVVTPSTKIEISAGPPRWLDEFMRSDAWAFMRGGAVVRAQRYPMAGKTTFDTLTPSYLADLWLRRLLSRACLDDMSEAELISMRTYTKNRTFEVRLVNDETGRHAAQRLDDLTSYMRRRFPRRGSTPPCEAVCV